MTKRVLLVQWDTRDGVNPEFEALFAPKMDLMCGKMAPKIRQALSTGKAISARKVAEGEGPMGQSPLYTADLDEAWPERVVIYSTIDYSLPLLMANPHYMGRLGGIRFGEAFRNAAQLLFAPSPKLQAHLAWLKGQVPLLAERPKRVGVHVRTQYFLDHPESYFDPESFLRLALLLQRRNGWADEETVFHVAVDTSKPELRAAIEGYAEAHRMAIAMVPTSRLAVKDDGYHNGYAGHTTDDVFTGVAELFMLSEADEMVGTFASTYSAVAAALRPYPAPWHSVWSGGEYRGMTLAEPCFFGVHRYLEHFDKLTLTPEMAHHLHCSFVSAPGEGHKLSEVGHAKGPKRR